MWSVVGGLVSTFALIRDLFAYFIPGAVLFGAVVLSGLLQLIVSTYSGGPPCQGLNGSGS